LTYIFHLSVFFLKSRNRCIRYRCIVSRSWKFLENLYIYLNERSPSPIGLYIYGISLNEKFSFSVARDFRVFASSECIDIAGILSHLTASFAQKDGFLLVPPEKSCLWFLAPTREILFSQITDPIRSILDRFSVATDGSPLKIRKDILRVCVTRVNEKADPARRTLSSALWGRQWHQINF